MRANTIITVSLAILATAASASSGTPASNPALQATSAHPAGVPWKSVPEDTSSWRREPFKKHDTDPQKGTPTLKKGTSEPSGELELQGILKSNRSYFAIINGRTVKTGDRIDGWTVSTITRHSVTVLRDKEKLVYDIYQGRVDRGNR